MYIAYFLLEEDDVIQLGDEVRTIGGGLDPAWLKLGKVWAGKKVSTIKKHFPDGWQIFVRRLPSNKLRN